VCNKACVTIVMVNAAYKVDSKFENYRILEELSLKPDIFDNQCYKF
jgi:hypothetical protein